MFGTHLDRIWTVFRPIFSGFLRGSALITGIGGAVAVCQAAALAPRAFACSTFWMVAGPSRRSVKAQRAGQEGQREGVQ